MGRGAMNRRFTLITLFLTACVAFFLGVVVSGPGPVEGMVVSLAACTAVDVVEILAKRRTPVESLEIDVVAKRAETVPRRLEHVMMNYRIGGAGIERVHAERAVELAVNKYCSVRESLRADIPVEFTVELVSR